MSEFHNQSKSADVRDQKPYQEGGWHVNEQAVLIQDVDKGQIVSHSNLVVIVVMCWGDFDGAWTESSES